MRRASCALLLVLASVASTTPISAQISVVTNPPEFSACRSAAPPTLPLRWRAVGLMAPFHVGQLDVGEFIYDGTLPAMRATIDGLQSGALDLLITDTETYLLSGPRGAPTSCTSLGRKFKLPSRQWLSRQAVCLGEAPIAKVPVQWWKTPGVKGQATWHWLRADTHLPWRSMFVSQTADPAIIGDYSFTYFSNFVRLPKTNLASLRKFCAARAKPNKEPAVSAARTARALIAASAAAAKRNSAKRIARLIPGLSHKACSRMPAVRWPEQFVMSAVITPISFADNPYPSLIYYDWADTKTQLALLWQGIPPAYRGMLALKHGIGYQPNLSRSGTLECKAAYPGIVQPDWATSDGCQCKGVLDRNTALSPNATTQIIACPIHWQKGRVMWNWYTSAGKPVLFAEAAARGEGAMLADYDKWMPGMKVPRESFNLPGVCRADDMPSGSDARNPSCVACHTEG
jgi:hypothetical protein